ncbi:RNA ligase family protein [Herbidospora cretacea]|uniref:RNA ligase family protein n=1 Tax=Herbidospora cretacea TaxID=28444 RepID=UPI0007741D01|nr:RNA ligase family protein [Herbidospora cretacea]
MPEFIAWPKTPRLLKPVIVTEKIDGTNGCVIVDDDGTVHAQSRKRLLLEGEQDNHGFGAWVREHSEVLAETLGPGRHFGEWWGHRIGRGYNCKPGERYFSLFNTSKWGEDEGVYRAAEIGLDVVPVLWTGILDTNELLRISAALIKDGSVIASGFAQPEGICIFHTASNRVYKMTFDKNSQDELTQAGLVLAA